MTWCAYIGECRWPGDRAAEYHGVFAPRWTLSTVNGNVCTSVYTPLEVVMALADLPITEYSPGRSTLPRLGHRQLRGQLGPILGQIHRVRGAVEVVNDGQREVVVMDHDLFTQLVDSHQDAAALRESLPLLIAAAAAGVSIPSQTLNRLGIDLPADPEALKRFRSGYPVRFTHDEDGTRLAEATTVATEGVGEADEDELVLLDVDD